VAIDADVPQQVVVQSRQGSDRLAAVVPAPERGEQFREQQVQHLEVSSFGVERRLASRAAVSTNVETLS
jgi:ribosome maturation factor RimP